MKALILNSGMGSRMGVLTSEHPKCMTEISPRETILSRQLTQLADIGVTDVIMTTGYFDSVLVNYCHSLDLPLNYVFVNNECGVFFFKFLFLISLIFLKTENKLLLLLFFSLDKDFSFLLFILICFNEFSTI